MKTEKGKYSPPRMQVIELRHSASILYVSPRNGGDGNIPPTDNDNNEKDW